MTGKGKEVQTSSQGLPGPPIITRPLTLDSGSIWERTGARDNRKLVRRHWKPSSDQKSSAAVLHCILKYFQISQLSISGWRNVWLGTVHLTRSRVQLSHYAVPWTQGPINSTDISCGWHLSRRPSTLYYCKYHSILVLLSFVYLVIFIWTRWDYLIWWLLLQLHSLATEIHCPTNGFLIH